MKQEVVVYIHGKGGCASEAEHYQELFPECDVIGLDYKAFTPWECKEEIQNAVKQLLERYKDVTLIANSIGAYFAMNALSEKQIRKAFFISPIVDMERLISDMMKWANVSESLLKEKQTIETDFGETLSWEYLTYVRNHPIIWNVPTEILYAGEDNLTARETITAFAKEHNANLTIMENGEHWFHTKEQMAFLDKWIELVM